MLFSSLFSQRASANLIAMIVFWYLSVYIFWHYNYITLFLFLFCLFPLFSAKTDVIFINLNSFCLWVAQILLLNVFSQTLFDSLVLTANSVCNHCEHHHLINYVVCHTTTPKNHFLHLYFYLRHQIYDAYEVQ